MDLLSIKLFEYLQIYINIISTEQCTFMFEYNLMIWSLYYKYYASFGYFILKFSGDYDISLVSRDANSNGEV